MKVNYGDQMEKDKGSWGCAERKKPANVMFASFFDGDPVILDAGTSTCLRLCDAERIGEAGAASFTVTFGWQ